MVDAVYKTQWAFHPAFLRKAGAKVMRNKRTVVKVDASNKYR